VLNRIGLDHIVQSLTSYCYGSFHAGLNVHVYNGGRSFNDLSEFVKAKADEYTKVTPKIQDGRNSGVNPRGEVIALDSTTYETTLKDDQPWMIEYYAPWCGHCKALAPIYEKMALALKGKVNVAKVDCPANEDICKSQKVRGYPTIKLHQHGQSIEFKKQRTLESLTAFALGATE